MDVTRIDRWLWAARFFKTRSLAKTAIDAGRVEINGRRAKPAHDVRVGDMLHVRRGTEAFELEVTLVSHRRGSATVAATMYQETPQSKEAREAEAERRRMERDFQTHPERRPDKKQRRQLMKFKSKPPSD